MEIKSDILKLRQLAKEYPYPEATLYLWAAQGRFPVIRIGRTIRVRRAAFEEFLRRHEVGDSESA